MMPIGTLTYQDGQVNTLVLLMDAEEFERILEIEYWDHAGLTESDPVHASECLVGLLMSLCDREEE
jgi:hypothetical protein